MSAIVSRFRETASRFPDRPALIGPDQTISYRELESRVAAAAAAIRQHATADTVALLCPNTTAFPVLLLAAMWAGKTIAILPTLAPAPLLKMMAAEVGAELVITTEEFVPRLVELQVACWIGEANATADPNTVPVQPLAQEASILLYTSGTTGRPKTVMLSEQNVLANAAGSRDAICFAGAERLPDQVALEFRERFHREILQGYGATEVSPVVSVNPPDKNHIGSAGRALPNLQISILDENDCPLSPNETGEVCVQGSAVMLGY